MNPVNTLHSACAMCIIDWKMIEKKEKKNLIIMVAYEAMENGKNGYDSTKIGKEI